ncbi:hypothetical protein GGTG_02688 [Gaeumannomyces tritici R3-111a-1]|uniref:Uncharacterized protein n=1 Tax=Gaeumannomyces tritici (strain R3-111a-1) TaxID=644352 RepID=J3NN30_GAET3|nr:hypothetical protein GGTG_02688 [Gaeumannomyces tritici R3-111a-1]EJT77582.1 hypothetical protein GGTG_02688 [Gaeumannomyces tritici R3-111a-1]
MQLLRRPPYCYSLATNLRRCMNLARGAGSPANRCAEKKLLEEVEDLWRTLQQLEKVNSELLPPDSPDQKWMETLRPLGTPGGIFCQIRDELEKLEKALAPPLGHMARVTAPIRHQLDKQEIQQRVESLARLKSTIT